MMRIVVLILFLCFANLHAETKKPNIIYILADDLGIGDLSCYGQQKIKTPNIDSLAEEGLKFNRHYSGSCVCAPSRSSLLTGLHTGHAPIRGNLGSMFGKEGQCEMPKGTLTLAEILRMNGYKTGAFGKWGLGAQDSYSSPMAMGFEKFFGYNCQSLAHNYYPDHLWDNSQKIILHGNANGARKEYSADIIHSRLMSFLDEASREYSQKGRPFFIYYAMTLPHAELISTKERMDKFAGRFEPQKPYKDPKNPTKSSYSSQEKPHDAFAAMVSTIDDYVGDIVRKLSGSGILDNSIIIFSSDNGAHLEGGHDPAYWNSNMGLRGYKRDLYEGGIRTPMIFFWPNTVKSGQTSHISAFWDILPTLCDIIGITPPANTDGISFLPLLEGKYQPKHNFLYWEFHEKGGKQAILKDNWKLVRLNAKSPGKYKTELYNLDEDPTESQNLAETMPQKVSELEKIMDSARTPSHIDRFNFDNKHKR